MWPVDDRAFPVYAIRTGGVARRKRNMWYWILLAASTELAMTFVLIKIYIASDHTCTTSFEQTGCGAIRSSSQDAMIIRGSERPKSSARVA